MTLTNLIFCQNMGFTSRLYKAFPNLKGNNPPFAARYRSFTETLRTLPLNHPSTSPKFGKNNLLDEDNYRKML